jgi:hypothetical protein
MTETQDLNKIANQGFENDPYLLGRIVSRLRENDTFAQKHRDKRKFDLFWRNAGAYWRCTIFLSSTSEDALAQIDLHVDGTTRVELYEPCSVTIDPSENLLVLSRIVPAE